MKEAPAFYSLYTGLIVVGGGIILLPNVPLLKILVFSQVANGIWLPVVLIFILLLINRRDLMGNYTNTLTFNIVAWATGIIMIILTMVLVYAALFNPASAGSARKYALCSWTPERMLGFLSSTGLFLRVCTVAFCSLTPEPFPVKAANFSNLPIARKRNFSQIGSQALAAHLPSSWTAMAAGPSAATCLASPGTAWA